MYWGFWLGLCSFAAFICQNSTRCGVTDRFLAQTCMTLQYFNVSQLIGKSISTAAVSYGMMANSDRREPLVLLWRVRYTGDDWVVAKIVIYLPYQFFAIAMALSRGDIIRPAL